MTGGPHPSATGGGARGDGGEWAALGREILLGRCARERGCVGREVGFLFFISIPFLKQANKFEFKPRFESKHSKTMHRHECNGKLLYFIN
jgi:hypothetical protein